MFRLTVLGRSLANCLGQTSVKSANSPVTGTGAIQNLQIRENTGGPPPKIECFVDGKKVLVDPGTTVLQVISTICDFCISGRLEKFLQGYVTSHNSLQKIF